MPRQRPAPVSVEPGWLERSLNRHLAAGIVIMAALVAAFVVYQIREPDLRATAEREQRVEYTKIGSQLFANNCASCHGDNGEGGDSPTLNAKEFLQSTTDERIRLITAGGISGTEMPTWSMDMGGSLTDQQIEQIVTYMRSWEPSAPSVPNWREGKEGMESDGHADEGDHQEADSEQAAPTHTDG